MKQKKAHASHPVGNRTVIGIICIVVALAIAICGLVIIVTAVLMLRFTKQIEYRK